MTAKRGGDTINVVDVHIDIVLLYDCICFSIGIILGYMTFFKIILAYNLKQCNYVV